MISVIIPAYNAQPYIKRCLDSVQAQTFTDFEVIVVDDGSTDRTADICKDYEKKDGRVHLYMQENTGVSAARNLGLRCAAGEWIAFIDADDYIDADYLSALYELAVRNDAQMAIIGNDDCRDSDASVIRRSHVFQGVLSAVQAMKIYFNTNDFTCVMWAKLLRRELFESLVFDQRCSVGEDLNLFYRLVMQCRTVAVDTAVIGYHHMIHADSLIRSCPLEERMKEIDMLDAMVSFFEQHDPELSDDVKYYRCHQLMYLFVAVKDYDRGISATYRMLRQKYVSCFKDVWKKSNTKDRMVYWVIRMVPACVLSWCYRVFIREKSC